MRRSLIGSVAAAALIGASAPFAAFADGDAPRYQIAAGDSHEQSTGQTGGSTGMETEGSAAESDGASAQSPSPGAILDRQQGQQTLASNLIGTSVRNAPGEDGEEIGEVSDLVLGPNNRVEAVVVGVGGFLGVGTKEVAVKWDQLDKAQADGEMILVSDLARAQLEQAEAFTTKAERQQAQGEDGDTPSSSGDQQGQSQDGGGQY